MVIRRLLGAMSSTWQSCSPKLFSGWNEWCFWMFNRAYNCIIQDKSIDIVCLLFVAFVCFVIHVVYNIKWYLSIYSKTCTLDYTSKIVMVRQKITQLKSGESFELNLIFGFHDQFSFLFRGRFSGEPSVQLQWCNHLTYRVLFAIHRFPNWVRPNWSRRVSAPLRSTRLLGWGKGDIWKRVEGS